MTFFVLLLVCYFIGSISSAVWVCHLFHLPDPRSIGSYNPGATNVLRMGNKKVAFIVLLCDFLKGTLPCLLGVYFGFASFYLSVMALCCVAGHVYPIWHQFKGGKGVATFFGTLFVLHPLTGVLVVIVWLIVAKALKISSFSGLIAVISSPFWYYLFTQQIYSVLIVLLIVLLIVWRHKDNIYRLLAKQEDNISL